MHRRHFLKAAAAVPAAAAQQYERPADTCAIQFLPGKMESRPAYEFIGPQSKFQRFSLGSVPLKPLASSRIHLFLIATVATF